MRAAHVINPPSKKEKSQAPPRFRFMHVCGPGFEGLVEESADVDAWVEVVK